MENESERRTVGRHAAGARQAQPPEHRAVAPRHASQGAADGHRPTGNHAAQDGAGARHRQSSAHRGARHSGKRRPRAGGLKLTRWGWLALGTLTLLAVALVALLLPRGGGQDVSREPAQLAEASPEATVEVLSGELAATAEPLPEATPEVTPEPVVEWSPQPMGEIVEKARPDAEAYGYEYRIVADGEVVDSYERTTPISMGQSSEYGQVEGVLAFRGNNYRDSAAYGTVPNDPKGLKVVWSKSIGHIDEWTGVGWTGQPAIVRWPEETRQLMNIRKAKRDKEGLCEVIYATLDGHIYFLDLDDGKETRDSISVPSSIKGSVSVDPRGLPLLYCGQGIDQVNGRDVELGTRIFSLIDQKRLFFLDGRDKFCLRKWYAFDCSPVLDASSDTLIHLGENGIVYTLSLNTQFDAETGELSIDPVVDRLVYKSKVTTRPGMENSPVVYDHYAYYTDNSGLFTCLDLNTMTPVWLGDVGDDSDGTMVLEEDDEGVWIYTACELDLRGLEGKAFCRKINALTGELIWEVGVPCYRYSTSVDAGGFASPAIGKGTLGDLVYFNICRTSDNGIGHLGALSKATGELVWQTSTGSYSWSSPVCVYDENGRGYVIYCNSSGRVRLLDGLTGKELAETDLGENIEGSPAVFDDMLVVGTRGQRIFGVRITN